MLQVVPRHSSECCVRFVYTGELVQEVMITDMGKEKSLCVLKTLLYYTHIGWLN